MKKIKRILFFLAFNAILVSCNPEVTSSTSNKDGTSKETGKETNDGVTMASQELMSDTYVGSFIIKEEDKYQAIYSSQNYDTFYQIYCKPHVSLTNDTLDSLEFRIINYKGPINIGFAENDEHKSEADYEEGILGLKLVVKGNSNIYSKVIDLRDKNIKKEALTTLFIYRVLLRLSEGKAMSLGGIFDSEFHTRSGFDTLSKRLVPGLEGYYKDSIGDFNLQALMLKRKELNFGAGRNCYSALNDVKWD
jgi:hypothetical protein